MKKIILTMTLALISMVSSAQEWQPTQPIRVIIGQTPGSGNEVIFRQLAKTVTEKTGVTFVIEHHPGVDGAIAWNVLGARPNDGHHITVQALETSVVALSIQYPMQLKTDPNQAVIVTPLASTPEVFVVHQDSPIKNYQDLVAAFRNKKLNVGTSGSIAALTYHKFIQDIRSQNRDLQIIPYKSIPTNLADLIGKHIDISVVPAVSTKSLAESGRIRIIAVADNKALSKDLSMTVMTQHIPDFIVKVTYTIFLPKGAPAEVVNWYINNFGPVIRDPDTKETLKGQWTTPFSSPSAEEAQRYAYEVRRRLQPVAEKTLKPVTE